MAVITGIAGGGAYGHIRRGMPLIEADDSWSDKLAAKVFVLDRLVDDARNLGCEWIQLLNSTGQPITQRKQLHKKEGE